MCMYGWVPLLSTWIYHNTVNRLSSNIKSVLKKKKKRTLYNRLQPVPLPCFLISSYNCRAAGHARLLFHKRVYRALFPFPGCSPCLESFPSPQPRKILLIFPHSVHCLLLCDTFLDLFLFLAASGLSWGTWDLVPWPGIRPRPLH